MDRGLIILLLILLPPGLGYFWLLVKIASPKPLAKPVIPMTVAVLTLLAWSLQVALAGLLGWLAWGLLRRTLRRSGRPSPVNDSKGWLVAQTVLSWLCCFHFGFLTFWLFEGFLSVVGWGFASSAAFSEPLGALLLFAMSVRWTRIVMRKWKAFRRIPTVDEGLYPNPVFPARVLRIAALALSGCIILVAVALGTFVETGLLAKSSIPPDLPVLVFVAVVVLVWSQDGWATGKISASC